MHKLGNIAMAAGLLALAGCGSVESGEAGFFTINRPRKMPNL